MRTFGGCNAKTIEDNNGDNTKMRRRCFWLWVLLCRSVMQGVRVLAAGACEGFARWQGEGELLHGK